MGGRVVLRRMRGHQTTALVVSVRRLAPPEALVRMARAARLGEADPVQDAVERGEILRVGVFMYTMAGEEAGRWK